jgi:TolB-like protein/DNA-binding winged helix-turn-helix (wHTH) protein
MLYRLGETELDAARFELRRGGQTLSVEPQVLELLLYLVAHRERAVTRAELFENLWRGRIVSESALNSRVKAARAAIGDDGTSQAQIRTLHRTGYRFVGEVEEWPGPAAAGAAGGPDAARGRTYDAAGGPDAARGRTYKSVPITATPFTRRWLGLVSAALGLLLVVGAFALLPDALRDGEPANALVATPSARPAPPSDGRKSLAVLPFTNMSSDAEQDYFADGIGEELLIVLSRLPDLRVTGRVSAEGFKGRDEPFLAIGKTLGVGHVLTGSVRQAGERVRIAVELTDAANGYQLWSESYDRHLGDILDVQDEIAEHVATALQVKLGLGESGELGMTRNVAAYDEFLRGYWRFTEFRVETIPLAIEHMHRALALDPSFSRAWAYLYCIHMDGTTLVPEIAQEWRRKALEALEHANSLTPESPFVQILNTREAMRLGRRLEARAAIDALPDGYWTADRYMTRDVFLGRFSISTGHAKEAIEVLERARAYDPLSPVIARYRSLAHAGAGDSAHALAANDRSLELGGSVPTLAGNAALLALGTGDRDEIKRRVAALPHDTTGHRAISETLVQHLDDPATARAKLHRLAAASPSPPDYLRNVLIAHWSAYYGDAGLALEQLNAIVHGAVDEALLWRPVLGEVRKLAGFKDLVRREGLVDYWRAYGWPELCRPTAGGDDFECR